MTRIGRDSGQGLGAVLARVAAEVGRDTFPTGTRAALRRMRPEHPPPLAFYRFASDLLPGNWEAMLSEWVTLVAGVALMSPGAHQRSAAMGAVLAQEGYAEARLERLLSAQGATLRTLALRCARFLASRGSPFDWMDMAWLLLARDPKRRERINRKIAKDFYLHRGRE